MSVAFRRESDDDHLEPKFALPLPTGPNLVTPRGLAVIEAKVAEWTSAVAHADNDDARKSARRDLDYWNTRLSTARVLEPPAAGVVGIGSRVTFRLNGNERTIEIVGHDEAMPHHNRIAYSAPLANTMLGAEAGDLLDFNGASEALEILTVA